MQAGQAGELIADLRKLHEEILAYRGGQLLDVDLSIDQMREEREEEILSTLSPASWSPDRK